MLVVQGLGATNYAPLHEALKVEDGTPSFEKKIGQCRDSMAGTTRKKIISRAASE